MKLFTKCKDGGPQSPVDGYFLIEWKSVFSIVLLKFNKGGRENYHTHAFNAWTWFLFGDLIELRKRLTGASTYRYSFSLIPKFTPRSNNHRVIAFRDSWCLSIRGPWSKYWTETTPTGEVIKMTHGRKVIS